MWQGMLQRALAGVVVLAGMAAVVPAASASIDPSLSVTSTTPATAGAIGSLGLDINFSPSSGDAPQTAILNLPPGVLADAALDDGACIATAISDFSNDDPCQIGSGDVTAIAGAIVPVTTPVNFFLVPPPAPGDLAGLVVATGAGDQIGAVDGISIRPSGNADGVGVTIDLSLPQTIGGLNVAVSQIASTFTGIRFPTTCPSTAAHVTLSADSMSAPSTYQSASAPLAVSGCSALAYNPQYSLTAVRDANDKIVKLVTTITQTATESPSSAISLAFPYSSLSPSIASLRNLCTAGPASGTCTPVASVTAASPDYPTALTGAGYLTGSLSGLSLTLVFPPPFPLTLVGSVNLKTNVTSFTGLPDIPLTSLAVSLDGGPGGLFDTNCQVPSNTSTATLNDQSGDKTSMQTAKFMISGCPSSSSTGSSGGSGGSGGSSSSTGATATAHVTTTDVHGLKRGRPTLRVGLSASRGSKLKSVSLTLPRGLSFVTHKVHKRLEVRGLSLKGGAVRSERLRHGVLTITLKRAVRHVTVTISSSGLKESKALRHRAIATTNKPQKAPRRKTAHTSRHQHARSTADTTADRAGL
jgi:hypothetical protein